ncbi:MAG: hypothetical protein ISS16_01470 [Ignavibacteria bacterium]|nr:hypothetical protein [Ignavibacteria bacterium]
MFRKKNLCVFVILFLQSSFIYPQVNHYDVLKKSEILSLRSISPIDLSASKSAGGLFVSPLVGLEFPFREFSNTATTGLTYGVKLEFASKDIYPFVIGGMFQQQLNKGDVEFKTVNRLDILETTINSFGLSLDMILNKYIKSEFTIPFVTLEAKYLTIQREISPPLNTLGLETSENVFGITGGLGFTLYIFDLYGTYTYAQNYSSFAVKARFHFPLIKF